MKSRLLPLLVLLLTGSSIALAGTASVREADLRPLPVSSARMEGSKFTPEETLRFFKVGGDSPVVANLQGARIAARFERPHQLSRLAIRRAGYADWALPAEATVRINGQNVGTFQLTAPRVNPSGKGRGEVDIIELDQPVQASTLEVVIESINPAGTNRHGSFRVLEVAPDSAFIDVNAAGGVPVESAGVELVLEVSAPVKEPIFSARLFQFRDMRQVDTRLQEIPKGQSTVVVPWAAIDLKFSLLSPASPLNFAELKLSDPTESADIRLVSWKFLTNSPAQPLVTAWDGVPDRQWKPSADNWRLGIPQEGFGRFGWSQQNGLLVGSVQPDGFGIRAVDASGKARTAQWKLLLGQAREQRWQRTAVDWTTVAHTAFYDYSSEVKNELAAKAPELLKETRSSQRILASVLAPGFLIDSQETVATIQLTVGAKAEAGKGRAQIIYPAAGGMRSLAEGAELKGDQLAEGWLLVVWSQTEKMPLLLAPKKRPLSVVLKGTDLTLTFDQPMERIGVSFPYGFREVPGTLADQATQIGPRERQIAAILRAYPTGSLQQFREAVAGEIEVEETISHLLWSNDWNEGARPVAPVSPLLPFAKANGYPVKLPANLETDLDWPTKYGPYAFLEGAKVNYTMSVPPLHTSFYLRPKMDAELARRVAAHIVHPAEQPLENWLGRDVLDAWYMWASASLAYPLLDDAQKASFAKGWKARIESALRPNIWFARREPFSGLVYPVSFGWFERSSDTIGDVNSGIGATLYAVWSYARCTGDWKFVEDHWPVLKRIAEYFIVEHDWAQMQTGAREYSASSAIDMDGIGYEGAVAFANMAEAIGQKDDAAFARLLVTRIAVPTCIRWLGMNWLMNTENSPANMATWKGLGVGLSEATGFDILHSGEGGPNHANSELALSISWVGQFPELYELHLWGLGRDFWHWFEYEYVEKRLQDWRKQYPGNRNNHPANITAHLYQRALLGEPVDQLFEEMRKQGSWGEEPEQHVSRENAGLYSLLLGRDFPVVLKSWGVAGIRGAEFDPATNTATLRFDSTAPFTVVVDVTAPIKKAAVGGAELRFENRVGMQQFSLPAGESVLSFAF